MKLKNVLLLNGMSSGATGLLLVTLPSFFAELFAVDGTTPFTFTGWFLILFAGFVLFVALTKEINLALVNLIISLDSIWVIGSFVLIATSTTDLSTIGLLLIGIVALWVLMMAVLQYRTGRAIES